MDKMLPIAGLLGLFSLGANAVEVGMDTCEQIREQISAQIGILPRANSDLLKKLSARQECHFSVAEVTRAAYGDKPLPKQDAHDHYSHDADDD